MRALSFASTSLLIVLTLAVARGEGGGEVGAQYEDEYDYHEDMPYDNMHDNAEDHEMPMTVKFANEFPDKSIDVYWEGWEVSDVDGGEPIPTRKLEGTVEPRGHILTVESFYGHEFSYDVDGVRHYVNQAHPTNDHGEEFHVLAGDDVDFPVRCELRPKGDSSAPPPGRIIDVLVRPRWSARGAGRFLALVRRGYYDGSALSRVVPGFLVQFGIARDAALRDEYAEDAMYDDERKDVKFEPGYVSFAGNGPDSRTTEIFIVMPGTGEEQLDYFGENSWETPFAVVLGDLDILNKIYSDYGDMPPEGAGPDSSRIYDPDGYEYLAENFPNLDYIDRCYIVDEEAGVLSVEL